MREKFGRLDATLEQQEPAHSRVRVLPSHINYTLGLRDDLTPWGDGSERLSSEPARSLDLLKM
jgi:hypothetical protein